MKNGGDVRFADVPFGQHLKDNPMKKVFPAVALIALACIGCGRQEQEAIGMPGAAVDTQTRAETFSGLQATNTAVVSEGSNSGPATAAPVRPRFDTLLASERRVIEGDGLSVSRVTQVISNQGFGKFVAKLAAEAASDPLAQDLAAAERKRWETQLAGQAVLGEFACGLSVCAGSIELGANTAVYDRIADDYLRNGTTGGSLLDYRVERGDGTFQQRFVMSVDPTVDGLTFDNPPGGKPVKAMPSGG